MKIHFSASGHDEAKLRFARLTERYGQHPIEYADCIVALGGDGHMLNVLHETLQHDLPVFGMNCGRLGFLMNHFASDELVERIASAETAPINPLRMSVICADGSRHEELAINEVSLIRQTHNAAHIRVEVDGKHQVKELETEVENQKDLLAEAPHEAAGLNTQMEHKPELTTKIKCTY